MNLSACGLICSDCPFFIKNVRAVIMFVVSHFGQPTLQQMVFVRYMIVPFIKKRSLIVVHV